MTIKTNSAAQDSTAPPSLTDVTSDIARHYAERFGGAPAVIVAAPGRVNLIGEHIDYNDGFVMPMAIDRYVVIAASLAGPEAEGSVIHSVNLQSDVTLCEVAGQAKPPRLGNWSDYVQGTLWSLQRDGWGCGLFNAVFMSTVPIGGGLSSSAAMEVATATMVEQLTRRTIDPKQKALLCQRAESEFVGMPCGIMDQFSSVFGRPDAVMCLDCRSQMIRSVDFSDRDVSILIINSNVQHELTGGQYSQRRRECDSALARTGRSSWRAVTDDDLQRTAASMSNPQIRRARHVVTEIERTIQAANAFDDRDWKLVGQLMNESHQSLRDDFEVSCVEVDRLVQIAQQFGTAEGVYGSRMTGGGFGGCTVTLVQSDAAEAVGQKILDQYQRSTGIQADCFVSRPALGAHARSVTESPSPLNSPPVTS